MAATKELSPAAEEAAPADQKLSQPPHSNVKSQVMQAQHENLQTSGHK